MTDSDVAHILTLDFPESPGIVHAVSGFLVEHGCDIVDNQQFGDRAERHFFMRVHVVAPDAHDVTELLREDFGPVGEKFSMTWAIERADARRRVLVMVSKFDHCLNDLLYRARTGDLAIDVVAVVSNHEDHRALVEWHGIPFEHIPVTPESKAEAEAKLLALVSSYAVDLVVLARYMQVLSDDLCRALAGRAINIHHSFLPSFKGGRPYHQAHARGSSSSARPPTTSRRTSTRGRSSRRAWSRSTTRTSPSTSWRWLATPSAPRWSGRCAGTAREGSSYRATGRWSFGDQLGAKTQAGTGRVRRFIHTALSDASSTPREARRTTRPPRGVC